MQVLQLLVEGVSIRSTERITGVEKKTILSLLERVGERCEMLLENLIRNVPVKDVQCDELWALRANEGKDQNTQGSHY